MSHTTTIKSVKVTNLNAMERAVEALNAKHGLNLRVKRNSRVQLWFETKAAALVVDVPGVDRGLNVGFVGNEREGYVPVFDAHGGWIADKIGGGAELAQTADEHNVANIGMLMHAYAVETVREVAGASNAMVTESFDAATGQTVMQVV